MATLLVMKEFKIKLNIMMFLCICILKHQNCPSNWFEAVAENHDVSVWHSWCTEKLSNVLPCDYCWEGIRHLSLIKYFISLSPFFFHLFLLEDSKKCIKNKQTKPNKDPKTHTNKQKNPNNNKTPKLFLAVTCFYVTIVTSLWNTWPPCMTGQTASLRCLL